jgi:hypothetical protein
MKNKTWKKQNAHFVFLSKIFIVPLHFVKETVNVFELSNIRKSFGNGRALNGVNLRLEKGFIYTLKY